MVKVVRPDRLESKWGAGGRWYRRRSRLRQYTGFLRELGEYLALRARCPAGELPLARVVGLVDTDLGLGLGLVAELIELDGQPAPSLTRLVAERGFGAELRSAVEELVARVFDCNIVVTDLRPENLLARRHPDGRLQLVLVDGFGDKTIIPRLAISPWLNRRNTRRRALRLLRQLAGTG